MRHFQPLSAVVSALKESTTLDIVDDDKAIQRKIPLPSDLKDKPMMEVQRVQEDAAMARSIYAKGFGEEEPKTQFDIEAFFAEFGSTNSVRLRRTFRKEFKGSVFVEFDSEETQKKFLALDPKPKWKGNELLLKSKKQYCDGKVEDIAAGRIRAKAQEHDFSPRKPREEDRNWQDRRRDDQARGFKDHRGDHKGFGSHGRSRGERGRGRGRGRGGGRRNERDDVSVPTVHASTESPKPSTRSSPKDENTSPKPADAEISETEQKRPEKKQDESTAEAERIAVSKKGARENNEEPELQLKNTNMEVIAETTSTSMKHARDEDDTIEPAAKKIDTKEGPESS